LDKVVTIPQPSIKVSVAFYDDTEKALLLGYPTANKIASVVDDGIEIPTAEFLTYYLFHRKRLGTPRYSDYRKITRKIDQALVSLDGCIDFREESITTAKGVQKQLTEITEHIGEAIGLSLINRIHDLTEADWQPIPEKRGRNAPRTFDFQIASDGEQIIQVENKGSSVDDNTQITNTIRNHKSDISEKKKSICDLEVKGNYPFPARLRYGTITAIGRSTPLRCWIVDPPPQDLYADPKRLRLLARMRFLWEWISFISPRSQIASSLATRIASLEKVQDPFKLEGIPLLRGSGKPFKFTPVRSRGRWHSSFFAYKSRVSDGPAGGVVLQLKKEYMFFVGIRGELLTIAAEQKFDRVVEYKTPAASMSKTVDCLFTKAKFKEMDLPQRLRDRARKTGGYFSLSLKGQLHYSCGGLVFGILPLFW